jgi:hypothetical protein
LLRKDRLILSGSDVTIGFVASGRYLFSVLADEIAAAIG